MGSDHEEGWIGKQAQLVAQVRHLEVENDRLAQTNQRHALVASDLRARIADLANQNRDLLAALEDRARPVALGEQYGQSLCTEAGSECSLAQEAVGRLRGKIAQLSSRATGTVQRQVLAYLTRVAEATAEQVALLQDMLAYLGLLSMRDTEKQKVTNDERTAE